MFQFKQFQVQQDRCAMKLGTDSVSLGAWFELDHPTYLLDIGTGSGILALMAAQRCPTVQIDAIDIDATSYFQAKENVLNTPWSSRIQVIHQSIQHFVANTDRKYDAIICNPPYFQTGPQSPIPSRASARHTQTLAFQELFSACSKLLSIDGKLHLIYPKEQHEELLDYAWEVQLHLNRSCMLQHYEHKTAKRIMASYAFQYSPPSTEQLIIKNEDGTYTEPYKQLTQDFYL